LQLYPPRQTTLFAGLHGESVVGPDPHHFLKPKKRSASRFVEDELRYRIVAIETFETLRNGKQRMYVSELRAAAMKTLVLEAEISKVREDEIISVLKQINRLCCLVVRVRLQIQRSEVDSRRYRIF
jgi:hypothetical protein